MFLFSLGVCNASSLLTSRDLEGKGLPQVSSFPASQSKTCPHEKGNDTFSPRFFGSVCLPLYFYRLTITVPIRVTCFWKNKLNEGHSTTQQELGAWKVAIPHLLGWHFLLAQHFGCISTMSRTQMEREKSIQPSGCFRLHNAMHLGPSVRRTEFFHFLSGCLVWCRCSPLLG